MKFNLKAIMESAGKIFTGTATFVTLASYLKNNNQEELKKKLEEAQRKADKLADELRKRSGEYDKVELEGYKQKANINELESYYENINKALNKAEECSNKLNAPNLSEFDITTIKTDISNNVINATRDLDKSSNILNKIKELADSAISSGKGSGGSSNYLNNFIVNLNELLSSLSNKQIGALGHIFGNSFILICLFSIVCVHYGDLILRYFNLEEKYPRLAKYIQLRRKFQQYYFICNVVLIVLASLGIMYVDFCILTSH